MKRIIPLLLLLSGAFIAQGQIKADFMPSEVRGCTPMVVQFKNQSVNASKYEWDLGNGNRSLLPSPSAIYYQPGKYKITLKALDSAGNWDTTSVRIQVLKDPKADFQFMMRSACEGEIVSFKDKSTEGDTTITSWSWDFGDGNLDTVRNAKHIFQRNGKFAISLYVKDANGCSHDTVVKQAVDIWPLPVADFEMVETQYCTPPAKVEFVNTSWRGTPHTYEWDFGDGGSSTNTDPTHSYQKTGTFSPRLIVTTSNGCKDTFISDIKIEIYPLKADFTFPADICGPAKVKFTNQTYPDPANAKYIWSIDGVKSSNKKDPGLDLTPGKHKIRMEASDSGCYDEITKDVFVKTTPQGELTITPEVICKVPQKIQMKFEPDTFESYTWYIDGQKVGNGSDYSFTAKTKKDYQVRLVVEDNGCIKEFNRTIMASTPKFTVLRDTSGCVPLPVKFQIIDQSANGLASFKWNFGDGDSSKLKNPLHTFSDTGSFIVKVTVEDSFGCIGEQQVLVEAGIKIKPDVDFPDDPVCNGDTVKFKNNTNEYPVKPHKYIWIIGDSMSITFVKKDLKYIFHQKPASKQVILEAHHYGCKDSIIADKMIDVLGPFSLPLIEGPKCAPAKYKFIDSSYGATSRVWLNAPVDGEIAPVLSRKLDPGKYIVGLATYNEFTGCRDTSYTINVFRQTPDLSVQLTTLSDCPPVSSNISVEAEHATRIEFLFHDQNVFDFVSEQPQSIKREFTDLPSDFKVYIRASTKYCQVDTTIQVDGDGPVADGSVVMTGTCFPYTLTLTDEYFGKDTFDHFWHIGNLTPIRATSKVMTYVLKDKIQGYDSIPIELRVSKDTCVHSKYFKFPVDKRDISLTYGMSEFCNMMDHTLSFKHKQSVGEGTVQTWGVNDKWDPKVYTEQSYTFNLIKDNKFDTLKVRVKYEDACVTQYSYVAPDSGKGIIAAFGYDTTGSICPPLFVNFKDKSKSVNPIIKWEWDLGDGSSSIQKDPGKIYFEPGRYGVQLSIVDNKGCADTVYLPEIIVVDGPKAELHIEPGIGCVPLTVNFKGTSNDSVTYSWDLGDGYVEDGQSLTHTYTLPGNYTPLLTIADQNNCKYTLPPDDRIRVLPYPVADFTYTNQCAGNPTDLVFIGDSSGRITRFTWNLDDDTTISDSLAITYTYMNGGAYNVSAVIENEGGCADSIVKTVRIYDAHPAIEKSKPGVCINDEIVFTDISTADTSIRSRKWIVNNLVIGSDIVQTISFPTPGKYPLALEIETEMGCTYSTTDTGGIIVSDTLALDPAIIRRVSVLNDETVEIKIDEKKDWRLSGHSVWTQDATGNILKIKSFDDTSVYTTINGLNTLHNVYCMHVKRESYCPTKYPDTPSFHCTVNVSATGQGPANLVTWTPYIGWENVAAYEIYSREEQVDTFSYLATVPGDQLSYVDSSILCRDERRYRIKALEDSGFEEMSYSDTAHAVPLSFYPVHTPEIWRASVENDEYVILEWIVPEKSKVPLSYFEILRDPKTSMNDLTLRSGTTRLDLTDYKVAVDDQSYIYKVRSTDTCGNISQWSNKGKTILLTVGFNEEIFSPELSWTKYAEWNEGVEKYLIERMNEDGGFDVIGQSQGPDDTTYIDPQAYEICNPHFCYRVTAIRNQPVNFPDSTHDVISHSNVMCSPVESHLYTPNAFTMNQDGLNETFQPRGMYLKTYKLQILSRWGELLYETTECFGDWDGTYMGQPCPVETYVYVVNAIGADGKVHQRIGTVHLLK